MKNKRVRLVWVVLARLSKKKAAMSPPSSLPKRLHSPETKVIITTKLAARPFCLICALLGAGGLLGPVDVQLLELASGHGETEEVVSDDDDDESDEELGHDDVIEEVDEETVETKDQETNTECVFMPEQGARKKSTDDSARAKIIKRSQTFSPSAAVTKNQYICRVNKTKIFIYFSVDLWL